MKGLRQAHKGLIRKPEAKDQFGILGSHRKKDVNWLHLAQDKV